MNNQLLLKSFARFTFFGVLGNLGVSCYILVDTYFVSVGMGADGLTALNLAIPVYNFIHGTGLMLGMGGATKFSICMQSECKKEVNRIFTNTVYLALLFSLLFVLVGVFLSEPLARFLGADSAVLDMTVTYIKWLLLFAPVFIFEDVLLCFVRNDNAPRLSTMAMLAASATNIILDYIFIFPLGMGIFGAVFATGLAAAVGLLMLSPHFIKRKNTFCLMKTQPNANIITSALSLGLPSLLAQVSSGVVMIVFNFIILGLEGNTGVAAYGIIANIALVVTAVYTGIAQGVQPLMSSFYGRGEKKNISITHRFAMLTMLIVSVVIYALIFFFADPIAKIFNSDNNAALQQIAVSGLKLYFISAPFSGFNLVISTYFTSIEKPIPAHIISIIRGFALIIPAAFVMSYIWKMTGVWLAYPFTELAVAASAVAIYIYSKRGKQKRAQH